MKERDAERRDALRLILNALRAAEKELQRPLHEDEELQVLQRERKRRLEAVEAFRAAGREEQAEKEEDELDVLEEFMPEPLSEDELEADRRRRDRRDRRDEPARPRPRDGRRDAAGRRPRGRLGREPARPREAGLSRPRTSVSPTQVPSLLPTAIVSRNRTVCDRTVLTTSPCRIDGCAYTERVQEVLAVSNDVAAELAGVGDGVLDALRDRLDCTILPARQPADDRGRASRASPRRAPSSTSSSSWSRAATRSARARSTPCSARSTRREDIREVFEDVVWRHRGKKIAPKTVNQKRYVDAIRDAHGHVRRSARPAPARRTSRWRSPSRRCRSARSGRIILTRPAVEAGERLGFLPGDMLAKVDPYLRPLFDALYDMLDADRLTSYMEKGTIEVAPLAFMRGRTLNDSFIILDEAQNTSPEQMQMFLTRLGFGSKVVVTGDVTQIDLPREQASGPDPGAGHPRRRSRASRSSASGTRTSSGTSSCSGSSRRTGSTPRRRAPQRRGDRGRDRGREPERRRGRRARPPSRSRGACSRPRASRTASSGIAFVGAGRDAAR